MVEYILTVLATALALFVVDFIFPGVTVASFPTAMLAGVVIGLINASIRPVLTILSLPITILSLGIFALFINGFCLWLATAFVPGFTVSGLLSFLFAPIILSIVASFLNSLLNGDRSSASNDF